MIPKDRAIAALELRELYDYISHILDDDRAIENDEHTEKERGAA